MIISGGSNIYSREIEEVLLRHPGVLDVSVVGRPHRDWGEDVVACIVLRPQATVTAEELDRLCLDTIAHYKRPRAYVFVDSLPKNNDGKVLKTLLRQQCAAADAPLRWQAHRREICQHSLTCVVGLVGDLRRRDKSPRLIPLCSR